MTQFSVFLFGAGAPARMTGSEFSSLLVIYGLGFAAVYAAVTLLHLHAWHSRDVLALNELERFDTCYQIFRLVTLVAIGLIAASLACIPVLRNWSALVYILLFPILRTSRMIHRRRRQRYLAADRT